MFLLRPGHNDFGFIREYAQSIPLDGALLRGRYVAPWASTSPRSRTSNGRELIDACVATRTPFVIDPDTTALMEAGDLSRAREMPHAQIAAQLSGLPMSPITLANAGDRAAFMSAAVSFQAGAVEVVAPYFRWDSRKSAWYSLNLRTIIGVVALGDSRPVSAFVHGTVAALVSGEIAAAAQDYAQAGPRRVYLRIAGFDPPEASAVEVRAYREAVEAFAATGVEVMPDAVGRFGAVLCVAGATGFSSGVRQFQYVPTDEVSVSDEQIGIPALYEVPRRWFSMTWEQARRGASHGVIPPCGHAGCDALLSPRIPAKLTAHNAHLFTAEARAAAARGTAAVRQELAARRPVWRAAL